MEDKTKDSPFRDELLKTESNTPGETNFNLHAVKEAPALSKSETHQKEIQHKIDTLQPGYHEEDSPHQPGLTHNKQNRPRFN